MNGGTSRMGMAATVKLALVGAMIAGLMIAAAASPREAHAEAVLSFEGSCAPDPVRPQEPVLVTCTTELTNAGDEAATNLSANIFLASECDMPSQFIFIDRTVDGETEPLAPFTLSFPIGDLPAGETLVASTRVAVENYGSGRMGASVTFVSQDDPAVSAGGDVCYTVEAGAAAPATNLEVTKTLLTEFEYPGDPFPEPPPRPDDGGPVPINPTPSQPYPEEAEFEIAVSNTSDVEMTSLTIVDVPTGGTTLVSADPPANGTDPAGRPTWDLSAFGAASLGPGEELSLLVRLGPEPGMDCAYADDLAIVTATPAGGEPEDYVALVKWSIPLGSCGPYFPDGLCWFYPPEGEPLIAPCTDQVCWAAPPGTTEYRPVFDCDPSVEYCWFWPPGEGRPELSRCDAEVCWIDFGGGGEYYFDVPCDFEYCRYASPDGETFREDSCDFPVCWSMPPEGGSWRAIYGCGEGEEELCWFSPQGGGTSVLSSCDFEYCFATPPPGAVTFGEPSGIPCEFAGEACWPVTDEAEQFYTYLLPCDQIEFYCWAISPGGAFAFPVPCEFEFCWEELPPDIELPPGVELPPDLLIPVMCDEGEEGKLGVPGQSVPAEVEPGKSTPAEIVEGSVERIQPLPSASVTPAEVIGTKRTEPAPPGSSSDVPEDDPLPPRPSNDDPPKLADVLGLTGSEGAPGVSGLPQSGVGSQDGAGTAWPWALCALGLLLVAGALRLRLRTGL